MNSNRGHWGSHLGFVLAASGSAIGLGNIWKFPYIAGQNGGGAFVLVYLICIALVGLPIFLAELYIGQKSQANAVAAFEVCHKPGTPWRWVGCLGVLTAFLILSFYSVVGGWVINFAGKSITNDFAALSDTAIQGHFENLFADYWTQILCHALFMIVTVSIVAGGIRNGIERWNKILMPTLLAILAFLLIYSFTLEGFPAALHFLFQPNFAALTWDGVLVGLGHSFFTLSLGMAAMITYGSYLQKDTSLPKTAATVALMDTGIALAMGLVIFAIVFSFGLDAGQGPTLMFKTLPLLFTKITGGYYIAIGFFILVAFAALTSAVSLLEVVVAFADETLNLPRRRSAIGAGVLIFALGILAALSYNVLADVTILGLSFFDLFDQFTSKYTMPFGGMMIAIFYGWVLGPRAVAATIDKPVTSLFVVGLMWSVRVFAPIAVGIILFKGIFG